jgi:hypothetical protein
LIEARAGIAASFAGAFAGAGACADALVLMKQTAMLVHNAAASGACGQFFDAM